MHKRTKKCHTNSLKVISISLHKMQHTVEFLLPKIRFPHSFSKNQPFFRQYHKFSIWGSVLNIPTHYICWIYIQFFLKLYMIHIYSISGSDRIFFFTIRGAVVHFEGLIPWTQSYPVISWKSSLITVKDNCKGIIS